MIILGIDPGYAITGYGVLDYSNNHFKLLEFGAVTTEAGELFSQRLLKLSNGIGEVMDKYKPDNVAIEELFFNTNSTTAIGVGQGRGICLLEATKRGIPCFEYTPLQVKMSIVAYGRAEKKQVQEMVRMILKLDKIPKPDDAADALAIAVTHAHSLLTAKRI